MPFDVHSPSSHIITSESDDTSLADLSLIPAVLLTFSWDNDVKDILHEQGYLIPELKDKAESL